MDNVEILMAMMAAFNADDLDEAAQHCHPNVVYTIRGHGPFAGTYRGVDALAEVLGRIKKATDGSMTMEPEVILSDGDVLMLYVRVHGSRSDGRTYDNHQAYLYRFLDGLLIEGQTIPVDQQAFDAFTSD
jgi:ketosteroid isomerase-like protein